MAMSGATDEGREIAISGATDGGLDGGLELSIAIGIFVSLRGLFTSWAVIARLPGEAMSIISGDNGFMKLFILGEIGGECVVLVSL